MPRLARKQSSTGIYHIMLRGNEGKELFRDDSDRFRFLDTLGKVKEDGNYDIYAYCLMNNHVHLLMKEGKDNIQRSMKRICVSYDKSVRNELIREIKVSTGVSVRELSRLMGISKDVIFRA